MLAAKSDHISERNKPTQVKMHAITLSLKFQAKELIIFLPLCVTFLIYSSRDIKVCLRLHPSAYINSLVICLEWTNY